MDDHLDGTAFRYRCPDCGTTSTQDYHRGEHLPGSYVSCGVCGLRLGIVMVREAVELVLASERGPTMAHGGIQVAGRSESGRIQLEFTHQFDEE